MKLQEANSLQGQKRSLKSALTRSQMEAAAFASKAEAGTALAAQLEQAQSLASAAQAEAELARGRITLLDKAWRAALEVGCFCLKLACRRICSAVAKPCMPPASCLHACAHLASSI